MSLIFLQYIVRKLLSLISSLRALLRAKKSQSCSMPRKRLPISVAAIPVVLLPANGSSIHELGSVDARIIRTNRLMYFLAQITNSVLYVKKRQEMLGGGLVFAHVMTLSILKPNCCNALATENILFRTNIVSYWIVREL